MKIIEALKQLKDLKRKLSDLEGKTLHHSADLDFETPQYQDQRVVVAGWVQAYVDIVRELERLQYRIQKTNLNTMVTITLGANDVTKSITQWIYRRKELSALEARVWSSLTNKNLKDSRLQTTSGNVIDAKIRLYFDPLQRDKALEVLKSEPSLINGRLEIVNAITDLME